MFDFVTKTGQFYLFIFDRDILPNKTDVISFLKDAKTHTMNWDVRTVLYLHRTSLKPIVRERLVWQKADL